MASITLPTRSLTAALFTLLAWAATPFTAQAQLPATSWEAVAPMPAPVAGGATLVYNGKIYVFAGFGNNVPNLSMYVYDPALNTWETMAGPSFGRGEVAAVEINGLFYLAGGYGQNSSGIFTALDVTEVFDPVTEAWSTLAAMPSGRSVVYSGRIGQEFYVLGGWPGTQNTVTKFNVQSGAWSAAPPLPSGRHNTHGACSIGGRIHCIGGKNAWSSEIYNDHFIYDGNTQSWSNAAPLPIHAWGGAIGHTEEFIFHTGGVNAGYGINTPSYDQCYVYSLADGEWFEWVPMSEKRSYHTSVVLDGYLYVIGGNDEDNVNLNTVERIAFTNVCEEPEACNYLESGTCEFPLQHYDCAGNCLNDVNLNGVCDEFDILGCTDPEASNFDPSATVDDGSCWVVGCTDPNALNFNPDAIIDDGSCETCSLNLIQFQIQFTNQLNGVEWSINDLGTGFATESGSTFASNGALSETSFCLADGCYAISLQPSDCSLCNFEDLSWAVLSSGEILANGTTLVGGVFGLNSSDCENLGCADPTACNFEQEGECVFAAPNLDCAGNCLNDCNNNGVCDEDEVYGCKYPTACNYNPEATSDDDSCTFPDFGYDCDGNCLLDLNNNGLCDLEEVAGCTNIDAINYSADATLDDGSCMVTCKGDFDNDGLISTPDLLAFLAAFGNQCAGAGCMDPTGCNYDPNATFDLDYCEYPAEFFNCEGAPINDSDSDGIPDELEVAGCTNPEAGNYNPDATDDNGSCTFGLTGSTHSCGAENVHNPDLVYGSVTDIDGNSYRTIVIGEQEWMAENLRVSHYSNGDLIPFVPDVEVWQQTGGVGAYCFYNNDSSLICPHGYIYNPAAILDSRNVCPTGWHVPNSVELDELVVFLGESGLGGKLKSAGALQTLDGVWNLPNTGATNISGFSAVPSGRRRGINGAFDGIGNQALIKTSTNSSVGQGLWTLILNTNSFSTLIGFNADNGSVRCLKDNSLD